MDTGTISKKNRRFIDRPITAIGESLGTTMFQALPGLHPYTGCDYTSAFYRKGKKCPFNILEKNKQKQIAFAK